MQSPSLIWIHTCAEDHRKEWRQWTELVTGDEPGAEDGEDGGAHERREDLALRQPLRHEPWQLQLRRRVRVAMSAHSCRRCLVFWTALSKPKAPSATLWRWGKTTN